MCSLAAPMLFDQDREEGLVVVLDRRELSGDTAAAAREAVALCPTGALRLADDSSPSEAHEGKGSH